MLDELEVMLIINRARKRWIIPKGAIQENESVKAAAERQAYEEAGMRGTAKDVPMGDYEYNKGGGTYRVQVFPFETESILEEWPESDARRRRWMSVEEAEELVEQQSLRELIGSLLKAILIRSVGETANAEFTLYGK